MKKFFTLAVIAIASVFGASAGDGYIGGSIGFMHNEKKGEPATNNFTILPEIGYNFNKTWAVGTTIGYDYTHYNGMDANLHMFEFNPYARFTFFRTSNNLVQLYVDGGAGIGVGSFDQKGYDSHTAVTWNVGFLGYKGANNAAFDGGKERKGGFFLDGNDLTLGFYYSF